MQHICAEYAGVSVVGYRDGYYGDAEEAGVAAAIALAQADILFVAMSSPRKEYFLARHGRSLGVPFVMGVGGAIDVLAGVTRRAPVVMQRGGLEWLFRFAQEPRRLGPRYISTNTRFVALLSRQLMHAYAARQPHAYRISRPPAPTVSSRAAPPARRAPSPAVGTDDLLCRRSRGLRARRARSLATPPSAVRADPT